MKKLTLLSVAATLTIGTAFANQNLQSDSDKAAYAMGYKTGQTLKQRNIKINTKLFNQGLSAGYQGRPSILSDNQMKSALAAMQQKVIANLKNKYQHLAQINAKKGKDFLAQNAKKKGVFTTASGLQYKILTKGHGARPKITDTVTVNYKGQLLDGTVFDSSYARKKPISFKLNQVIKGWQQGLTMMKPGATWVLYIPSDLAYGSQGTIGKIGPNETLIFKVQLLSVER